MEEIELFRGISVARSEVEKIIEDIKTNGLKLSDSQMWGGFVWKDLNSRNELFAKEDLSKNDTAPATKKVKIKGGFKLEFVEGTSGMCFADALGAEYYARKHNVSEEKPVPVMIKAKVSIDNVAIDGRDFLYAIFSRIRGADAAKRANIENVLTSVFGEGINRYIQKQINHPNSDPNAICDLIICDRQVIIGHNCNTNIIYGRHGTHFKSAFFVKAPVLASQITDIETFVGKYQLPIPTFKIMEIF